MPLRDRRNMLARRHNRRCGSKARFPTEEAVHLAMTAVVKHAKHIAGARYGRRATRAYPRKACGFFHWGHI